MKHVGPPARHEIGLHRGHTKALVHVELIGLHRHLLDILQPHLDPRRRVAAKLHPARTADHAIDIVSLRDRG